MLASGLPPYPAHSLVSWRRWHSTSDLLRCMLAEEKWLESYESLKRQFDNFATRVRDERLLTQPQFEAFLSTLSARRAAEIADVLFPLMDRDGDNYVGLQDFALTLLSTFLEGNHIGSATSAYFRSRRQLLFTYYDSEGQGFLTPVDWQHLVEDTMEYWARHENAVSRSVEPRNCNDMVGCFDSLTQSPRTSWNETASRKLMRLNSLWQEENGIINYDVFYEACDRRLLSDRGVRLRYRNLTLSQTSPLDSIQKTLVTSAQLTQLAVQKAADLIPKWWAQACANGAMLGEMLSTEFPLAPEDSTAGENVPPQTGEDVELPSSAGEAGASEASSQDYPYLPTDIESQPSSPNVVSGRAYPPDAHEGSILHQPMSPESIVLSPASVPSEVPARIPNASPEGGRLVQSVALMRGGNFSPQFGEQAKPAELRDAADEPKGGSVVMRFRPDAGKEPKQLSLDLKLDGGPAPLLVPTTTASEAEDIVPEEHAFPLQASFAGHAPTPLQLTHTLTVTNCQPPNAFPLSDAATIPHFIVRLYLRRCIGFVNGTTVVADFAGLDGRLLLDDLTHLAAMVERHCQSHRLLRRVDCRNKKHVYVTAALNGDVEDTRNIVRTVLTVGSADPVVPSTTYLQPDTLLIFPGNVLGPGGLGTATVGSLQVLACVWSLRVMFPDHVIVLRGVNESCLQVDAGQTLLDAFGARATEGAFNKICDVWEMTSLGVLDDCTMWAVGGGLTPALVRSFAAIERLPKPLILQSGDPLSGVIMASYGHDDMSELIAERQTSGVVEQAPPVVIENQCFSLATHCKQIKDLVDVVEALRVVARRSDMTAQYLARQFLS